MFYIGGEPRYLVLLLSVFINYFVGLQLRKHRRVTDRELQNSIEEKRGRWRKCLLFLAVAGNISVLLLFKIGSPTLGLPLGISFYTFQIVSYLIDVYRGDVQGEWSFVKFATYIAMFPRLVSGPIVYYGEVEKELEHRTVTAEKLQDGFMVFTIGLGAKVLLADRIGVLWHEIQVTGFESISTPLAWLGAFAYSMKIYFDFYGYSLMAVGLGKMLGFHLPANFRTPYMARSVRDFYRRWHITLGRWFCRYVYIPLGGSRRGEVRTIVNLGIVWLLTALWHGNTWNYLLWGMLLLLCIIMERQLEKTGITRKFRVLPHLYVWFVIPISWMCFAITDCKELEIYLGRMFGLLEQHSVRSGDWLAALHNYGWLFGLTFVMCTPVGERMVRNGKKTLPGKVLWAAVFWICVWRLMVEGNNPFLYFRF